MNGRDKAAERGALIRRESVYSILIIDRLAGPSARVAARLRREGHVTLRVRSVAEAIRSAAGAKPDLILLNATALGERLLDRMNDLRCNPTTRRVPVEFFRAGDEDTGPIRSTSLAPAARLARRRPRAT